MDWDAFHHRVVREALPTGKLREGRFYVGILFADTSPEQQLLQESDFVWIIAHGKITVDRIRAQYREKDPNTVFELVFNNDLAPTTTVKDLNIYGDNNIFMRAVPNFWAPAPAPAAPSRLPLHPVNPVNRQPPGTAPDDAPAKIKGEPTDSPLLSDNSLPSASVTNNIENRPHPSHGSGPIPPMTSHHASPAPFPQMAPAPAVQAEEHVSPEEHVSRPPSPEPEPIVPTFNPADVFAKETDADMECEAEARPTDAQIRKLIETEDVELLEAGVAQAIKVLDILKGTFSRYESSDDAKVWMSAIDKLKQQAQRTRTVVGVVGNTGAGKSSVINAMLDEERLVPTNCMRACTAVVTELSWNDSMNPNAKYRADIEFISPAEWQKELDSLMKEFLTENGTVSRETSDQNSEAGIAWAKFHAVYPKKTKEMLAECTVADLMRERSVLSVLGTTKNIAKSSAEPFFLELKRWVDSKEKATGKKKDKEKPAPVQMEYWPLIKVVKIQTKSPALSTGAVIVDLPGVHDSNAARAAVAQGYLKQCTGLWIVAPINRAVDDKAAKTLLGDSFKRQLKYDGGFGNVTFICSKTDDISITEATDSLELEDEISGLDDEERKQEEKENDLQDRVAELKESQAIFGQAYDEAVDDIELWDDLKDRMNEGKPVYAPVPKSAKRKRGGSSKKSRKRRQTEDDDDEDFIVSDDDASVSDADTDNDDDDVQAPRQLLTEEDIEAKLDELKETKKSARRQRNELDHTIKDVRLEIRAAKAKREKIRAEMSAICIAGRNEYSKGAIQLDFAAGVKELDQENAAEEDEENFNPDEEIRDYDAVARSLPVFCVSSKAYQKMCGRHVKDDDVPGFKTPEETEIPQLQAHCKKLTEAGRIRACRTFLRNLCQQMNTFSFWASDDGSGLKLSDQEKRAQVNYLNKRLNELEKGLEKSVESCIGMMKKEMESQIYEKYPEVIEEAINAAPDTAQKWGAHKNYGGLHYMTYKAIVRRDGAYTSPSAGFRDFNAELVEPITKRLATGWERTFQNRLPKAFQIYIAASSTILHKFHDTVEERARNNGVGLANLAMLKNQIYTYEQLFKDLYGVLITSMTELQREANRDFTPMIVAIMSTVYDLCSDERGTGSFMRMKQHMVSHVDRVRHQMFKEATGTVQAHLNQMCKNLQQTMENKADEIFVSMRHDYLQVLGGVKINQDNVMSKEERVLRAEIKPILMSIDNKIKAVIEGTAEEDEAEVEADVNQMDDTGGVKSEAAIGKSEEMKVEAGAQAGQSDEMEVEAGAQVGQLEEVDVASRILAEASERLDINLEPASAKDDENHSGRPEEPKQKRDPVTLLLSQRASTDPTLSSVMRLVAARQATDEQLSYFQRYVAGLTKEVEQQKAAAARAPLAPSAGAMDVASVSAKIERDEEQEW